MIKVRVLVVDDSVVIRRLLAEIIAADPAMEVVGTAADGAIALAKIPSTKPDIVTLDVEMPGMSGLDVLVEIKRLYPQLPVVMFSAVTERAAAITLDALARGATDYVTKPSRTGSREASVEHVQRELLPKLRMIAAPRERAPGAPNVSPVVVGRSALPAGATSIVAIGASTGGPNAISQLVASLPRLPVPIVIAQHMPPVFTRMFASRLTSCGVTTFFEAEHGMRLEPGRGYVAPGDYHLRVVRDGVAFRAALDQAPPENSVRPAVDVLFRSVAETVRGGVMSVVLTGMGQDGLRGVEAIRRAGGVVIAQDEATSVVWGMPGIVARERLAHAVLPLGEIAKEIARRAGGTGMRLVG